ncbi:MAG: hypothetical protein D6748_14185 [Calditrichaeota bacterium]|nr:MAG: hypothetical protein D6748_14185 [Calditrichota bacterium]
MATQLQNKTQTLALPDKGGLNLQRFRREIFSGTRKYCAVEFDRHVLKMMVVEGRATNERVRALKVKLLSTASEEELILFLNEFISDANVPAATPVLISIPQNIVHIKLHRFPSEDPEELTKMISYHIRDEIPIPVHEIIYDFKIVEQTEGYSRVLIALARERDVAKYVDICHRVGLKVTGVRVNIEMIFHSFTHFISGASTFSDASFILVDVDFSATNVLVVEGGQLKFCRSVSQGVATLIDDVQMTKQSAMFDNWIDDLSTGIQHTMAVLQKESEFPEISTMVVTGWLPRKEVLITRLRENLQLAVEWFDPLIPLKHFSNNGDNAIFHHWFSISALLGMIQSRHESTMDLRPPEVRKHQKRIESLKQVALTTLLLIYMIAISITAFTITLHQQQGVITTLEEALFQLKPQVAWLKKTQKVKTLLKEQLGGTEPTISLLAPVLTNLPRNIQLNSITFIRGEQILLRGRAHSMGEVFMFTEKLSQEGQFEEVLISSADRKINSTGAESIEFEMKVRFKKP